MLQEGEYSKNNIAISTTYNNSHSPVKINNLFLMIAQEISGIF